MFLLEIGKRQELTARSCCVWWGGGEEAGSSRGSRKDNPIQSFTEHANKNHIITPTKTQRPLLGGYHKYRQYCQKKRAIRRLSSRGLRTRCSSTDSSTYPPYFLFARCGSAHGRRHLHPRRGDDPLGFECHHLWRTCGAAVTTALPGRRFIAQELRWPLI